MLTSQGWFARVAAAWDKRQKKNNYKVCKCQGLTGPVLRWFIKAPPHSQWLGGVWIAENEEIYGVHETPTNFSLSVTTSTMQNSVQAFMIENTSKYLPTITVVLRHHQNTDRYTTLVLLWWCLLWVHRTAFQFIYSQELFLTKDRKFLFWQVKDDYKTRNNETNLSQLRGVHWGKRRPFLFTNWHLSFFILWSSIFNLE